MPTDAEHDNSFEEHILGLLDALYGTALRLTKNREDAEDLVAEAVSKAWSNRDQLKDLARFRPWIFRILTNTFMSHCRKEKPTTQMVTIDEHRLDEDEAFSLFEGYCQFNSGLADWAA